MPRLDEIDLALPLQGTEGVSIDYLSAIRTQYLFSQHQSLMAQIRFADAKAAALMTLMGLIAFRGPFAIPVGTEGPLPLLPALYFLVITISIAFCILSVFPRYPRAATRDRLAESDLWSWPSLVAPGRPPTDYATYMQTSEVSELVHSVALSNGAVAGILLRKFMLLRIAFIAALGVLLLVALRISGIEAMI